MSGRTEQFDEGAVSGRDTETRQLSRLLGVPRSLGVRGPEAAR